MNSIIWTLLFASHIQDLVEGVINKIEMERKNYRVHWIMTKIWGTKALLKEDYLK